MVVMTPDEWDDMAGVMWGNFEDAVEDVKRTLLALLPQEGFAVYAPYRLYPSIEARTDGGAQAPLTICLTGRR